jgi:hypothetical protein
MIVVTEVPVTIEEIRHEQIPGAAVGTENLNDIR